MRQKEKTPVPPRSDFEVAISAKNHTHKTIRALGFIANNKNNIKNQQK
jgi:hypothetical protein